MSAVARTVKKAVKSVGKALGSAIEAVGDLAEDIVDVAVTAVEDVGRFVKNTVEAALDDPLGTLATIATAVYAPYLLPVVSAGRVVANGGNLEDALKAAAVSYVSGQAGQYVGQQIGQLGTAATYGTDLGSAQTALLSAQSAGMDSPWWNLASTAGRVGAAGATTGVLTGRDPIQMALNAIGNAGINFGTNFALDAAGRLVDSAGNLFSDTSESAEITNPAQEGDVGYGFRYFNDGTVIDPFGNYFKDNQLIWSPHVQEIENLSQPGDEAYGWRYFSDGTVMSPQGEYFNQNAEMIWSPFQTEEVVSLTEGAKLIDNPAGEGEAGYGWKYYDNGVVISPDGEYYQNNELVWSPFEEGAYDFFDRRGLEEIPNTAKEGEEGYGWRYFTDGTTMDPNGRYLDQEGNLLWQPGEQDSADPSFFDSKFVKGAKDYFTRQIKNQFAKGVTGGLKNLLLGSDRGRQAVSEITKAGKQPTPETLAEFGFGDLLLPDREEDDFSEEFQTAVTDTSEGLFNPLESMSWAPQTKIGGLGSAGKYINQEADTYFPNKEQEQKQRAREALQTRGWLTDEEQEALGDEGPYFDYDPTNYDMAPWIQPTNEQPVFAAEGGLIDHNPEFYSEGGASFANRYVKGDGDGTSDSVPAMLASGEFVIPADVVSGLGNGDNDAGAKVLDQFMVAIRKHKRNADPSELPPDSAGPLSYLAEAMKKAKK